MVNVMIDLETLGVGSSAAILSIGAVKFDPHAAEGVHTDATNPEYKHFFCSIAPQSCIDAGLELQGAAITWWLEQGDEARTVLMAEPHYELQQALGEFWAWFGTESLPTWGNGSAFDCVVLRNAFIKLHGVAPFVFRDERCYRTVRAMFPLEYVPSTQLHHPLHDAIAQATHLQKLYRYLNSTEGISTL